ncbi:MAG: efflux RND transporter permease subunit, partial [Acidobacteria bacterium]|nr:efflux RND transporter permease subunit [Acidobacteriota bacterium]
ELNTLYDRSLSIRNSVDDVKFTLLLTVSLVVLVIFLFLRNISATVIPSLALPMSIVGTFAVMYQLGYSLDNLSLMALTLSVGFVVDDAIVMLENIVRHMEQGVPVMRAALQGSREISFTILSMTLSLAAVFIPVLFMGGIVGRLLHEFAVTIASAILVSGFVSLSLTPMLCSRFLRPPKELHHGWMYNVTENFFKGMLHWYDVSLQFALRHRAATMVLALLLVIATVQLYGMVPKGFLPSEDLGQIFAFTEGAQGISFEAMKQHQMELAEIVRQDENVDSFMPGGGFGGGGGGGAPGQQLAPVGAPQISAEERAAAQAAMRKVPQHMTAELNALLTRNATRKRTVLEIRDFLSGEFEPLPLEDLMGALKAREKLGSLKFTEKPEEPKPAPARKGKPAKKP